jgi:AcrR family transcriptional regulator
MSVAIEANPRKELVREQLIAKAAELFDKQGYAETRIEHIANAMGLSRSALYHYFPNKEQIVAAIVEEEVVERTREMDALIGDASLTPLGRLRQALTSSILRKLHSSARFRVVEHLEAGMSTDLRLVFTTARRRVLEQFTEIISSGIRSGEFRAVDPKMAAFAVLGMANWTAWWYSPAGSKQPHEIANDIVDIALRGLAQPAGVTHAPDSIGSAQRMLESAMAMLNRLSR